MITSPFESEMWRTLRLSIDYYNIQVNDAIGVPTVDVAQLLLRSAFNPTFTGNNAGCAGIGRVANDGALGNRLTYYNNGRFDTSGIDIQIDWAFDLGPGRFSLNSIFNYLNKLKSRSWLPIALVEYAGSLGPTQNGSTPARSTGRCSPRSDTPLIGGTSRSSGSTCPR